MKIAYDRNYCCTAACISNMSSYIYAGQFGSDRCMYDHVFKAELEELKGAGIQTRLPSHDSLITPYVILNEKLFLLRLALCCAAFKDVDRYYSKEENVASWSGRYEIGDLSTVFCFTSTGDHQQSIEEYLKNFGFDASAQRSSKKYYGNSLVTLWSMDASLFQHKCDKILEEYRNDIKKLISDAKAESLRVEAEKVQGAKEEAPARKSRKARTVSAAA